MRTLAMGLSLALATAAAVPMAMAGQMNSSMSMQKTVMVGGAAMYPSKNIIENAVNSKDHTTLVAAVKAAGLVETLEGPGPFTVFAPTNEAFAALPAGTVDNLLKPENKATLTKVLTYHVVPGKYTAHDLAKLAKAHGGKAMLKTVEGDSITVAGKDGKWTVTDAKGNVANITIADVTQSNGEIFVIDKVLMP
nr:fasciclin domain-containing protein [Rhodanobacter thiooxydans]